MGEPVSGVADRPRFAHTRSAHEMKPTTRLEKIEIGRLLEQSSLADDAAPAPLADEPSVPTVVATLDHLPLRLRVEGSDVQGSAPVARPAVSRERVAMRALDKRVPTTPWLELIVALIASAWIAARLVGL
jgi:hypothetical protein